MTRGFLFSPRRTFVFALFDFLILSIVVGLSGCAPTQFETTIPVVICTPESPLVNVYRVAPQPWANAIFESAFPSNPSSQSSEQQILDARYTAFQQLIKETTRWSDSKTAKMDDSSQVTITLTYISPELLQVVFLNQVLKDRSITNGFQDQLQKVLNNVAERNELLFLLTMTMKNNNVNPTPHTVKIPIQSMVMNNAENITITHTHDDHNLEQFIDSSADPVFGYLAYPLAGVSANQCKWTLDPKYNTNIVITVPFLEVDGVGNKKPYFWTIPYISLIGPVTSSSTYIWPLPGGYDQNLMTPLMLPPSDINQATYLQDFARFVWNQITLANYY